MAISAEKTNFTIKMDKTTRDAFDALCANIGISMSAGINALIKQAVRDQEMTFSLLDKNGFTPKEAKKLKRRIADAEAGKLSAHDLIEV